MQRFVTFFAILITTVFVAGCGGGSSTATEHTVTYSVAELAPVPSNNLMGGAIQGGAITAKFTNYSVSTFAGTADTVGSDNNTATTPLTTAQFNRPMGITTDGINFYVTDYLNNAIRKIDPTNQIATTLDLKENDIAVTLNHPSDITTDGTFLYVVDSGNNVIRKIDPTTSIGIVTTIGSITGIAGAVDSTVAADVRFKTPFGITTDGKNLYVTDIGNHTIRRINISDHAVTTLAGYPDAPGSSDGTQSDDHTKSTARFNQPAHITTNGKFLYMTDFMNRTIRQINTSTGEVITIAGKAGTLPGRDDADATVGTEARFNQPNGITTDGTSLYVTDSYNNTIRKISLTAPYKVEKIAGITYSSGQEKSTSHFWLPVGITTDGTSLYVADSGNHVIRKIQYINEDPS
ncbi:MAG: hypothetical protein WC156_07070 [Pedobacter sp.]